MRGDDGNIYFIDPLIRLKKPAPEVVEYLLNTRYPKQEMFIDDIEFMGSRTDKKIKELKLAFENQILNEQQKKIVNTFTGQNHNEVIRINDLTGIERKITFKLGNENTAGIKHAIYRHFSAKENSFNKEDILLIPTIIERGERTEIGNKVSYKCEINGIKYTLATERRKGGEDFVSFYTNKKPIVEQLFNTENQHGISQQPVNCAKVIQNFENPRLEEEKNKIFKNIDDIEFQFKQDYCNNFKQLDFKELKSKIKITEFAEYIGYKLRKDKTTHKHLIYEHSSGEKICIYNNPDGKPQIYMTIGGLNADKGDIISFVKNKIDNGIINKPINGTSPFEKVNILLHEYLNIPFEDRKVYNSLDEYIQKSKQNLFISDYQPYTGNITIKAVEYMSTRGLDSNDFLVYPFRGSVVGTNTAKIEADINKIPNNQVAFPLYDKNEKIVGVQLVSENYKSFLKGSRKSVGVWHSNIPEKINNIVICEAPLDAISYHKLQGDSNTLYFATCGNVTDGQLDAIKSIIENNKNVLAANYTITLANDNDAAGAMFNLNYILSTLDEKGNTNIHFNNTKDGRCDLMISLSSADTNNLLKLYDNLPKEDINLEIKAKDGGVNILYSKDIKTISALNDLLLTSKPQNIKIDVPITKDYNEDLKTLQHINSLSSDKYSYQDVKHNSFLFTDDISKFHKEKKKHRGIKF